MITSYYVLAKPGIIRGNAITAAAGFFLAYKGHFNLWLFFAMLLGISLVIASGCVFNNYIDRDIDAVMERTKHRVMVHGLVSKRNALIYGIILGLLGIIVLLIYTNLLTVYIAIIGFFFYVVMYGIWKRRSIYGTIVGSISGAVPPLVGYCAVSNRFDGGAFLLFIILCLWQMPHFYAIAMYRLRDYQAASIPVLPAVQGIYITKVHMLLYIIGFIIVAPLLTVFGYTGKLYAVIVLVVGLTWLAMCIKGFRTKDNDERWARGIFLFSLVVVMVFSVAISIDALIRNSR